MDKDAAVYERLDVWKLSHALALEVYRLTESLPRDEAYGLRTQLRRAALAIPTNIAEGNARGSPREFMRFCLIARGSLAETRYLLRFTLDLGTIPAAKYVPLKSQYDRVGKMLYFLITKLAGDRGDSWTPRRASALSRFRASGT
jgi:four helix bundle protein